MSELAATAACRLCGALELTPFLRLDNSPANISFMLRADQFHRDKPISLEILHCAACGFVQIRPGFGESFYQDYLMTTTHSPQMQEYQEEQAAHFVKRFGLQGRRVVEVGCGDGNYLQHLKNAGAEPYGIEPSERFRKVAIPRGFVVHGGYVGRGQVIPGARYDAFATRQVLEHVPDVNDFLLGIRQSLRPGAVGLIEVPSLEQTMEGIRFYDFFADHVNYFSARTLRFAAERNGFDVLEVTRGMNGEYNVALVRMDPQYDYRAFHVSVDLVLQDLRQFMAACRQAGQRVAIWGAGGKGVASAAVAQIKDVAYVIDSDPYKHGLHTPVCHIPIVPPSHLRTCPVDAIILTALAYKAEILRELREHLQFTGVIAVLGTRLEVLNT
jgi:SAM-dependent methyltransferase